MPPEKTISNIQYDLFSQFITNDKSKVSNTVESWESIPKYFFTPAKMKSLRTPDGFAKPYEWNYIYNSESFSVEIQPALLKQKNGGYRAYFPSTTEELVEEALKKIFSDQRNGMHDPKKNESWVKFSLSMLHKELKVRGRERNRNQIKKAIKIMSSCTITLYKNKKEFWTGSILQDLITVGRDEYIDDTNSMHIARLPVFISNSINKLEYRQFNYDRLMGCDEQLTRWLYKKFINRFKQASRLNTYHFMYSDVAQNSGLLQQSQEKENRRKVISSIEELIEEKVLISYEKKDKKEGRKIVDVKYTVIPSQEFISEQKAANKRSSDVVNKANKFKSHLSQSK